MRVLLVDDDPATLRTHARQLNHAVELRTALGVDEARAILDSGAHVDVLITDYFMPDGSGADVLAEVKRHCPKARGYIVSGNVAAIPEAAVELADDVLSKGSDELSALLRSLGSVALTA